MVKSVGHKRDQNKDHWKEKEVFIRLQEIEKEIQSSIAGCDPKIHSISMSLFFQEHKAEMYLDITGFRVECREKEDSWAKAKVSFFNKSEFIGQMRLHQY